MTSATAEQVFHPFAFPILEAGQVERDNLQPYDLTKLVGGKVMPDVVQVSYETYTPLAKVMVSQTEPGALPQSESVRDSGKRRNGYRAALALAGVAVVGMCLMGEDNVDGGAEVINCAHVGKDSNKTNINPPTEVKVITKDGKTKNLGWIDQKGGQLLHSDSGEKGTYANEGKSFTINGIQVVKGANGNKRAAVVCP